MTTSVELHSFGAAATALVIGASGGIGNAIARQLACAQQISRVVGTSRSGNTDDSDEHGFESVRADLSDETSIAALAATFSDAPPDIVINAAGLLHDGRGMSPEKRLEDIDANNVARSFAVNATGPLLVLKHFIPLMRQLDRGVIANLSARVGSIGDNRLGGWYAYRASKAAQNMLTRTAAIEARRRAPGIIIVGLHPGTVDTTLSEPFQANVPDGKLFEPEYAAARLLNVIDELQPADSGNVLAWDGTAITP